MEIISLITIMTIIILGSNKNLIYGQSNLQCDFMDFNMNLEKPDIYLEKCDWREEFILQAYSESDLTPFRPASNFFMTNLREGITCGQTITLYSLNENSEIEIALNFDFVNLGAEFEVIVTDMSDSSVVLNSLINSRTNGWIIHRDQINRVVDSATVRK